MLFENQNFQPRKYMYTWKRRLQNISDLVSALMC